MRKRLSLLLVVAPILVSGCQPSPSRSPLVQPSEEASDAGTAGLPPGCEALDLRDPTGERVVLDGRWTEVDTPDRVALMTWWILTEGDCVWGAGQQDEVELEGMSATADQVQGLSGHIGSDFTITGEILWLGPVTPGGASSAYSPLRMLIEFGEAGQIFLREDREPDVPGPRCPVPQAFCPDPLVLEQAPI
jgi:hypothetical protein